MQTRVNRKINRLIDVETQIDIEINRNEVTIKRVPAPT